MRLRAVQKVKQQLLIPDTLCPRLFSELRARNISVVYMTIVDDGVYFTFRGRRGAVEEFMAAWRQGMIHAVGEVRA